MKPVAWIKVRELAYMKAVEQHGKDDWQTNLGLKPEPDDEGLFTETQVQQLRESFEQSITDPENQPSQYGTVPLDWHLRDEELMQQALEALERSAEGGMTKLRMDAAISALRERLAQPKQEPEPVAWRYALDASVEGPRWIYIDKDLHKWLNGPELVGAVIEPLYLARGGKS